MKSDFSAGGLVSAAFTQAFASMGAVTALAEVASWPQGNQIAGDNSCQRTFDAPSFLAAPVPGVMFPARGTITTATVVNGRPVAADAATMDLAWLVVNHIKHEFILFGQVIDFRQFKPCCLRVLLALCNWPSEKVRDDDLFAEARLRGQVTKLASYISRGVRPILRPIVEKYGPEAGVEDDDAIKYALIVNERKEYQNGHDRTRYYLAIPPEKVQHIHSPDGHQGQASVGQPGLTAALRPD
jgi:hypothetical protein